MMVTDNYIAERGQIRNDINFNSLGIHGRCDPSLPTLRRHAVQLAADTPQCRATVRSVNSQINAPWFNRASSSLRSRSSSTGSLIAAGINRCADVLGRP